MMSQWRWSKALGLLFLVGLISLAACARAPQSGAQMDKEALFQLMDRNRDGRVSKEEFTTIFKDKPAANELFNQYDKDRSGFMTREEFLSPEPGITIFRW